MKEEARPWVQERFERRSLEGDINDQVDYAVTVLRIYEDYLNEFEPMALREISEAHLVANRLDSWLKT